MKKTIILCMACCLLLVGCGNDDKLLPYMDQTDVGMVDTREEANAYQKTLDREDHLQWTYHLEKIDEMLSLEEMLREEVEKVDGRIWKEGPRLQKLKTSALRKVGAGGKGQCNVELIIETKKKKELEVLRGKIENMGYPGVATSPWDCEYVSRGLLFWPTPAGEEEDGYELRIQIPLAMLYYPQEYQELLKKFWENHYYIESLGCYGGPVNQLLVRAGEKNALFRGIQLFLDRNGKVIEIVASMEAGGPNKVRSDSEREVMAEVLTRLTGDQNEAIAFINNYSCKGRKGTIAGKYNWTNRDWEEMITLHIQ